jgi:hypothetical protein
MFQFKAAITIILLLCAILAEGECMGIKTVSSLTGGVFLDGRPVTGTVFLKNEAGDVIAQQKTSVEGRYRLTGLKPGAYTIHYLNYQGVEWAEFFRVELRPGMPEIVDLQLHSEYRLRAPD